MEKVVWMFGSDGRYLARHCISSVVVVESGFGLSVVAVEDFV